MRQRKPSRQSGTSMDTPPSPSASPRAPGRLGRDVQAKIGNQLRALYDDIVQEGVPDRFVELLQRLDDKAEKGSGS
jgi:Anti-sigma factor NepR